MVPNGDEWQGKRMLYITFDLSSHRVSWFFLHMASWIKMSGNFCVSVASLVAFITLFCSSQALPCPVQCIFEVKIPPIVVTSKTLSKRKINQFGIQKHTCMSTIHVSCICIYIYIIYIYYIYIIYISYSDIFTVLHTFLYISPTSQVAPQVSHPKTKSQRRHAGPIPS